MKLLEIEIHNVRGIVEEVLTADGKNLVIWGPNGSGKSAVVDAIDFVLTGKVTRLEGTGTGKLKLRTHGPHIDRRPVDATVRAKLKVPGIENPIEIKRSMATPSKCEYERSLKPHIEPLLELAKRGQHVLTRREVLKFVTADANTRATEIQELLNIKEIELTRKALVAASNILSGELKNAQQNLDMAKKGVSSTAEQIQFDAANVLKVINRNRQVLGGQPIRKLRHGELKKDITPPIAQTSGKSVNVTLFEGQVRTIRNLLSEGNKEIAEKDENLRSFIASIKTNPTLLRAYSQRQLIVLGQSLLDESGKCPLCETDWPDDDLSVYLGERLLTANSVASQQEQIRQLSETIVGVLRSLQSSIENIINFVRLAGFEQELSQLQSWIDRLKDLISALEKPLEKYPVERFSGAQVKRLLAPDNVSEFLTNITEQIRKKYPESSPEQTAWDTLTSLVENVKILERDTEKDRIATLVHKRAVSLVECFEQARNKTLSALYHSVKDRFVEFYRFLHGSDEENFGASLQPDGAALNFEVDFHGRGPHPPHALHSEGHQDSMGLCLYLALAERLTEGKIDLIILDDVVMSVDATHRMQLCRLMNHFFPNRQFLITTHDRNWAHQLRSAGMVNKAGLIEFYNWNVATGPSVNHEPGMWEKIKTSLDRNDIPSAAGQLRRGSEEFYSFVCENLQARVTYKPNGRWELGELLPAAVGRYKDILKQAKRSAQSWSKDEIFADLNELDSTIGQIQKRLDAEGWTINTSVHYNEWENLTQADFLPVFDAFQDLYAHLTCATCGSILYVTLIGQSPESLRCSCDKINWNLKMKPKN